MTTNDARSANDSEANDSERSEQMTRKDFVSGQTVRWCPGCGDYAILSAMQNAMPQMGLIKEDIVFVSGIGCASRFPYYMQTYGFHTIHGRGPTVAMGIKLSNPKLSVWEISGDGDALAIGGNHFIHALRRNIDINLLIFNNEIYGLTKGQYSPTSKRGTKSGSTPMGSIEMPFIAAELALGARATFYARTIDTNPKLMSEIFTRAEKHRGTSLVEILQNCVIYNDNTHATITSKETKDDNQLHLEHGKPMLFGKDMNKGIRLNGLKLEVVNTGDNGSADKDILIHDAKDPDPTLHIMLARMSLPTHPMALGVIRAVEEPTYDEMIYGQIEQSRQTSKIKTMDDLLNSGNVWDVK